MAKKKTVVFNEQQFFNKTIKGAISMFLHESVDINKELECKYIDDFMDFIRLDNFIDVEKCKKYNANFSVESVDTILNDISTFFKEYIRVVKNSYKGSVDNYKECEKHIKRIFNTELSGCIDIDVIAHVIHKIHNKFYSEGFESDEFISIYENIDDDTVNDIRYMVRTVLQGCILIGTYVFISLEKPKNYYVKSVKRDIEIGKLKYEYSSIKVIDQEEIALYRDGAGLMQVLERFMTKNKGDKFSELLYTIIKISSGVYSEEEQITGVWSVGDNVSLDMPFVEVNGSSVDDIDITYKDENITANMIRISENKKYAFPVDGCSIEIFEDETYVKSMTVEYKDSEYIFTIILNDKWFEKSNQENKAYFVVPEDVLIKMRKEFSQNNWDGSMLYYSSKSTVFAAKEDKKIVTKWAINLFLIHVMYCIENEIENSQILIKNNEANERSHIKGSLLYRTAKIEKENSEGTSFYNKIYYRQDDNDNSDRYIIDDGYLYVEECNIYNKKVMNKYIGI